jgi:hypothetical protein
MTGGEMVLGGVAGVGECGNCCDQDPNLNPKDHDCMGCCCWNQRSPRPVRLHGNRHRVRPIRRRGNYPFAVQGNIVGGELKRADIDVVGQAHHHWDTRALRRLLRTPLSADGIPWQSLAPTTTQPHDRLHPMKNGQHLRRSLAPTTTQLPDGRHLMKNGQRLRQSLAPTMTQPLDGRHPMKNGQHLQRSHRPSLRSFPCLCPHNGDRLVVQPQQWRLIHPLAVRPRQGQWRRLIH